MFCLIVKRNTEIFMKQGNVLFSLLYLWVMLLIIVWFPTFKYNHLQPSLLFTWDHFSHVTEEQSYFNNNTCIDSSNSSFYLLKVKQSKILKTREYFFFQIG